MIQDQSEYEHARTDSAAQAERLKNYEAELRAKGHTDDQVKRAMDPLISFHLGRREEIKAFEQTEIA